MNWWWPMDTLQSKGGFDAMISLEMTCAITCGLVVIPVISHCLLRAYCTIYSTCQLIIGCCCCTLAIKHTPLQVRMWVWKKATFGSLCLHICPLGAPTCMASMFPSAAALRVRFRAGQRKSAGGNSTWLFSYSTLTWYCWIDMRWKINIYPITNLHDMVYQYINYVVPYPLQYVDICRYMSIYVDIP